MTSPDRPFTFEDLEGMPDDGYRREIIGGSLIVSPSPRLTHQRVVGRLFTIVSAAEPPGLEALVAPFDWRPEGGDVFVPDLLVMRVDDVDASDRLRRGENPILAVEVLSPSNRVYDLITKRAVYEAAGLAHYWIIDPTEATLLALRLDERGRYAVAGEAAGDEAVTLDDPFPVRFTVAGLIRR